ncbi:MAG: hypothetical protein SFZ02_12290 [bacterium]|nr:hypothetical protein [bacterium]
MLDLRTVDQLINAGFSRFQMCDKPGFIMPGLALRGNGFEEGDTVALYGPQCVEVYNSPRLEKHATSDPDIFMYTYKDAK